MDGISGGSGACIDAPFPATVASHLMETAAPQTSAGLASRFERKPMLAFGALIAANAMWAFQFAGARIATEELGAVLLAHQLASICEWPEMAASACLASYGTTLRELYAMEAALTHKMLKGASPADTPAQQPTRFELVVNLKTAKALGLTVPPSILARADEVIE